MTTSSDANSGGTDATGGQPRRSPRFTTPGNPDEQQSQASEPQLAAPTTGQTITLTPEALSALVEQMTRNQTTANESERAAQSQPVPEEPESREARSGSSPLDQFSGQPSEDAEAWLEHFKACAKDGGWSEKRKCTKFGTALRAHALKWFSSLPEATQEAWPALESAFVKRYCPVSNFVEATTALLELRQGPTEPVPQFAQRLLELLRLSGSETMNDASKATIFRHKLRPEIRKPLSQQLTLSLEQNIEHATHIEIGLMADQKNDGQVPASTYYPPPPSLSSLSSPPSLPSQDDATVAGLQGGPICHFCKRSGHTWQQCYACHEFMKTIVQAGPAGAQGPPRYNSRTRVRGRGRGQGREARRRGGHVNAQYAAMQDLIAAHTLPPATTSDNHTVAPDTWIRAQWPGDSVRDDDTRTYGTAPTNPSAQPPSKN
jgi:Retrotransposon gag protein